ncbi:putative uncharacterized protein DDB_G0282129 [Teleopsis dalmanni]|uniref:putative uncharacterized protein DDB_G0282129 n=1 Tax=Teleopsis dalmanni TaxID=139649 RepID=UPI0018CDB7DC|nr:putative uncharacterized protein DDB_G0282129 [Teleopsis dalmanni]
MNKLFLLLLLVGTAIAATHVDISIAQKPITNPADVTYIDGKAPVELRAGPAEYKEERFARLEVASSSEQPVDQKENEQSNQNTVHVARVSLTKGAGNVPYNQQHGYNARAAYNAKSYNRHLYQQQRSQLRQPNEHDRQNQEFERYIQNYHSGPTVETVYDTASQAPQRYQQAPSSSASYIAAAPSSASRSERLVAVASRPSYSHQFERQVAVASVTPSILPASDTDKQSNVVVNQQVKPIVEINEQSTASEVPLFTPQPQPDSKKQQDTGGFVQQSFDPTPKGFNKPSFEQPSYSYDDTQQPDLSPQYPPTVEDSQYGYGGIGGSGSGYYGNNEQTNYYGQTSPANVGGGYYPHTVYQRPVVTKTIQIAQPALKAKKYEVRHPAIQKEFYDIEERVVIKPAGTIVVELEHPVAKIPRGETILPLGHPHPAVASAYSNGQGVIQTEQFSTGSYNGRSPGGTVKTNQYNPNAVYNEKPVLGSTTIGSAITTKPSYESNSQEDTVEASLNKQYNGDSQYVEEQSNNEDFYVITDGDGNQQKVSKKTISPAHVEIKSNGVPLNNNYANSQQNSFNYNNNNNNQRGNAGYIPNQSQYPANYNDNNQYKGEYFAAEYFNKNNNNQQDAKPARLQEQPVARENTDDARVMHVIKHEHNIHLPPAQHNIYVNRLEQKNGADQQQQNERQPQPGKFRGNYYNEEAAHVQEVKPFLEQHKGGVVVYASQKPKPNVIFQRPHSDARRFIYTPRVPPNVQYHGFTRKNAGDDVNKVQYSAPYSNMRYVPEESARLTENVESNESQSNQESKESGEQTVEKQNTVVTEGNEEETQPRAHIQIQIPQHPQEADKPIFVGTTISPPIKKVHKTNYHVLPNGAVEKFTSDNNYQKDRVQSVKPDCDDQVQVSVNEDVPFNEAQNVNGQQKFMRLVESPSASTNNNDGIVAAAISPVGTNLQAEHVDVSHKGTSGLNKINTPSSRVIASTPAPNDSSSVNESFHKRRIVVNHPFQTVREVVEHEPITNYHQVRVNEPASAPYYQTHGSQQYVVPQSIPVRSQDYK